MRIALAIPPAWSVQTAPLGAASVGAYLIRGGHDVKLFDLNVRLWNLFRSETEDLWDYSNCWDWENQERFRDKIFLRLAPHLEKLADEVAAWRPQVLGLSLYDTSLHCGREFSKLMKVRIPELVIVYGGPAANKWSFQKNKVWQDKVNGQHLLNFAVVGEGEASMLEAMDRLEKRQSLTGCLGIAYLGDDGNPVYEPTRPNLELNKLPNPHFADFDFRHYRNYELPVMMSRGCVAKCTFCSETRFWNKFRYREAWHIFDEFKNNLQTYGMNTFAMADSLINGNFKVLSELADLILASGIKIDWHGYARIDRRMTRELLEKLAKSGLTWMSFGLETGSQKIMDLMEKNTTVETAREVIRNTFELGIRVHINIIVGFPGETEDDFQATIHFLRENIHYISVVNTGETLGVAMDTPLGMHPEKFSIRTNDRGLIDWSSGSWVSTDGSNTLKVRRERLERLRTFLDGYDHILQFPGGELRRKRFRRTTFKGIANHLRSRLGEIFSP